jgi:hypothetical protein
MRNCLENAFNILENRMTRGSVLFVLATLLSASVGADGLDSISQGIRGAESNVKGQIAHIDQTAQDVFRDMAIQRTGQKIENSGADQTLVGKMGKSDVEVHLSRVNGNETHVAVIVKEGAFTWKKDVAQKILTNIVLSS